MSPTIKGLNFTQTVNIAKSNLPSFSLPGQSNLGGLPSLTTPTLTTVSNLSTLGNKNNILNLSSQFPKPNTNWGLQTTNIPGIHNVSSIQPPQIANVTNTANSNTISNTPHVAIVQNTSNVAISDPTKNSLNVATHAFASNFINTATPDANLFNPIGNLLGAGVFKLSGASPITPEQHAMVQKGEQFATNLAQLSDPKHLSNLISMSATDTKALLLNGALSYAQDLAAPYRGASELLTRIADGQNPLKGYWDELASGINAKYATAVDHFRNVSNGDHKAIDSTFAALGIFAGLLANPYKGSYVTKAGTFNPRGMPQLFDAAQDRLIKTTTVGIGRDVIPLQNALDALNRTSNFGTTTQIAGKLVSQRATGNLGNAHILSQDIIWALEKQRPVMGDQAVVNLLNKHLHTTGENRFNNQYLRQYRDDIIKINEPKPNLAAASAATKLEPARDIYAVNNKGEVVIQIEFKGAKLTDAQRNEMGEILASAQNVLKQELPKSVSYRGNEYSLSVVKLDNVGAGVMKRGDFDSSAKPIHELTGTARSDAVDAMQTIGAIANKKLFDDAWASGTLKNTDTKLDGWEVWLDTTRIRATTDSSNKVTGFVIPDDAIRLAPPRADVAVASTKASKINLNETPLNYNSVGFGRDVEMHNRSFARVGDMNGTTTIYAHGDSGGRIGLASGKTEAEIFSRSVSAQELAIALKADGHGNQPIRLMICKAGDRGADGSLSTAEVLAKELGVPVIAGKGDVNPFVVGGAAAEKGVYKFTPVKQADGTVKVVVESLDTRTFPK